MKLKKQPTDVTTFGIDFTGQLASGDYLTSSSSIQIISGDNVLVLSAQQINSVKFGTILPNLGVIFTASIGTNGFEYVLRTICTTQQGQTITGEIVLLVLNSLELNIDYYGNILRANQYFQSRLNSQSWNNSDNPTQRQALFTASQAIDKLNFKGSKADPNQLLEFPRQGNVLLPSPDPFSLLPTINMQVYTTLIDTLVPQNIELATYELAFTLLDGKDPDTEFDSLRFTSSGYSSVRSTYNPTVTPVHVSCGIPSIVAWNLIRPYLIDGRSVIISRVN